MLDKNSIIIVGLVLIVFVILNYRTPVVEGAKFNIKKIGKDIKKGANNAIKTLGKEAVKGVNYAKDLIKKDDKSENTAPAAAVVAATAIASSDLTSPSALTSTPPTVEVPSTISAAAETPLPVDFKEVQGYLDKLKTYSADAQTLSKSVSITAEDYKKAFTDVTDQLTKLSGEVVSNTVKTEDATAKAATMFADINLKTTDIQANVNSNNIIKNEIGAKIIEMREIEKNVLGYAIDASMSAYNAKESAERAGKALAGILPTSTNNTVLKSVEGFTGFNSSVLEGYTVFSNPNLPSGSTNNSAFDLENILVDKINKFNTAYYTFLSQASPTNAQTNALTVARSDLDAAITALNTKFGQIDSATPKITNAIFDASHSYIKTTATQIETLRADLDMKMQEILKTRDGVPSDYTNKRDMAAYTTILWTALATSALFFIFVKID
jgi:ribosomal protein S6